MPSSLMTYTCFFLLKAIKLWSTIILVLIFVQHSHGSSSTLTDSLVSMLSSSFASHGESPLSGRSLKSDIDFGAGFGDESSSRDDNNLNLGSFRQLSLASTQPFIQRRLFNTSVALTIPIFSFTLPQRASQGSTVDLANQVIHYNQYFYSNTSSKCSNKIPDNLRIICASRYNASFHSSGSFYWSETHGCYRSKNWWRWNSRDFEQFDGIKSRIQLDGGRYATQNWSRYHKMFTENNLWSSSSPEE